MKLACLLLVVGAQLAWAETIVSLRGERFEQATITRADPAGLAITHADGVAYVLFPDLPLELRQRYHYDPAKDRAWRMAAAKAQRAAAANEEAARKAEATRQWWAEYNRKRQQAVWAEQINAALSVYDPVMRQYYPSQYEAAKARAAWLRKVRESP